MDNNNYPPLWMPTGSVRAILAIGFVLGLLVYVFIGVFWFEKLDADKGLMALEGLAGAAFVYYFGVRRKNGQKESGGP